MGTPLSWFHVVLAVLLGAATACTGRAQPTQVPPAPSEPKATPVQPESPPSGSATQVATGAGAGAAPATGAAAGAQATPPAAPLPKQGQRCPQGVCAQGLKCVTYYGFAGPKGPQFSSCEIPCVANINACPDDQHCITISDGPGQVCRPRN